MLAWPLATPDPRELPGVEVTIAAGHCNRPRPTECGRRLMPDGSLYDV